MEKKTIDNSKFSKEAQDIIFANEVISTLNIKGKDYAEVNQRVKAFRLVHPYGKIETQILKLEGGFVLFKAIVSDKDGNILATGHAYEIQESSLVNKTSFIENCVPIDTMILTDSGWKYYYQLKPNQDKILSLNLETLKVEYTDLIRVNYYKNKPIVELKTSRFLAKSTPEHKWVVGQQYKDNYYKTETYNIKTSEYIIQNHPQEIKPSILGKKLGWLMCDCEIKTNKNGLPQGAEIRQSKYVDEITELFGQGTQVKKYKENWLDSYRWIVSADEVREILGYFNMKSYKDLANAMLKADIEDVRGCYESMMLADGTKDRGFYTTYYELIEAMEIMCVRLGLATGIVKSAMKKGSTKPIYTLPIKKTHKTYFSEIEMRNLPPQDVFCPTTGTGTWFMKQGNFITLTSNCETSAIGRALGMCGYGIDTSLASADEVKNAIDRQEKIVAKEQAKAQEQEKTTSNAQDKKKFYEIMNLTEKGKLLTLSEVGKLAIKIHGSYIDINELNQDEFNELKEQVKGIIEEKRANREKKELEKVKSQKDLEKEAVEAFKYQDVDWDDKPSDEENEQFKSDLWGE